MNHGYPEHDPSCTCHLCVPPPPWEPTVIDPNIRPAAHEPPAAETPGDAINPGYYRGKGGMQPVDFIDAFGLNFNVGTAVVYLARAGRKSSRLEDLRKGLFFLQREIAAEEARR